MVEWIETKYENIAGWLNRQEKQKDGWMDIKNEWIEIKMDGWRKTNRWMVGRKTKLLKKQMVGWMDRKKKIDTKMEDRIDRKIWMVGWIKIDEKTRWMVGWIEKKIDEQIDGWLNGYTCFFKDRLLVGWTGNHRRMVGWIHKWMAGWI